MPIEVITMADLGDHDADRGDHDGTIWVITIGRRTHFTAKLAARYPNASIHIDQERVAVVLDSNQSSAILTPSLLFNYSLGFQDTSTGPVSSSRQHLTSIPLTGGAGHNVFPVPGPL